MSAQRTLLDEINEVTERAIDSVGRAADPKWMKMARLEVRYQADSGRRFTTDDIWQRMEQLGVEPPRERRALGAVMREMQKAGVIRPTGEYVKSSRIECHRRPVMIWVSAR